MGLATSPIVKTFWLTTWPQSLFTFFRNFGNRWDSQPLLTSTVKTSTWPPSLFTNTKKRGKFWKLFSKSCFSFKRRNKFKFSYLQCLLHVVTEQVLQKNKIFAKMICMVTCDLVDFLCQTKDAATSTERKTVKQQRRRAWVAALAARCSVTEHKSWTKQNWGAKWIKIVKMGKVHSFIHTFWQRFLKVCT